jgi:WD40 repeat protein
MIIYFVLVDTTICIWEKESANLIKILNGHSSWVMSVAISPCSKYIVSGSGYLNINIYILN